ncbi:MAG: ATP-binding protein [Anaerolineaceae bacterium]|nr:ATP-binding protein [Anaerolineaceae bacterium]
MARIGDFVRKIAQDAGFENFAIYSIELAVDEACSNIIEHAYQGEGKGNIRCTCSANETALTITLMDWGQSFDPANISQPNLSHNLSERESHGLGLYFIRQWMDEVNFTSNGPENILTMVKRQ